MLIFQLHYQWLDKNSCSVYDSPTFRMEMRVGDYDHHKEIDCWQNELLKDPSQKQNVQTEDDILVCECFCIGLLELGEFYQNHKESVSWNLLEENFQVGRGCGTCKKNKAHWMKMIKDKGRRTNEI